MRHLNPASILWLLTILVPLSGRVTADQKTNSLSPIGTDAIRIFDAGAAEIVKDPNAVNAKSEIYEFDSAAMPSIGETAAGQKLYLGGFSGLQFEGIDPKTGCYRFISHTDRGPNAELTGIRRTFLLPNFTPEIIRFELDPKTRALRLTQRIPLQRAPGKHTL